MTEFEKKQSGEIYDARDPELRKQQNHAKNLMRQYNSMPAENTKERNRILSNLFGSFGKNARVNQPIYVDYGYNIHLGNNSLLNMHCTLLDTAPIIIGECTMVGPDTKIYTAVHALDGAERFWQEPDGIAAVKTQTMPVHWQLHLDRWRQHHLARRYHRGQCSDRRRQRGDGIDTGQRHRLRKSLPGSQMESTAQATSQSKRHHVQSLRIKRRAVSLPLNPMISMAKRLSPSIPTSGGFGRSLSGIEASAGGATILEGQDLTESELPDAQRRV